MNKELEKVYQTSRIEKNQFQQEIIKNTQSLFDIALDETSNSIYGAPLRENYHPLAMINGYKLMLDFMIDNRILETILPEASSLDINKKIHHRLQEYKEFVQTLYYQRELNEDCIKLTKEMKDLFKKICDEGRYATPHEPSEYTYKL